MAESKISSQCRHCKDHATQIVSAPFAKVQNVPMCATHAAEFKSSLARQIALWAEKNGFQLNPQP